MTATPDPSFWVYMKNKELGLSESDFAAIKRKAAEYHIEELPFRQTQKGGNFPFGTSPKGGRGCLLLTGTGNVVASALTRHSFPDWRSLASYPAPRKGSGYELLGQI
jgi:hypothetical protein